MAVKKDLLLLDTATSTAVRVVYTSKPVYSAAQHSTRDTFQTTCSLLCEEVFSTHVLYKTHQILRRTLGETSKRDAEHIHLPECSRIGLLQRGGKKSSDIFFTYLRIPHRRKQMKDSYFSQRNPHVDIHSVHSSRSHHRAVFGDFLGNLFAPVPPPQPSLFVRILAVDSIPQLL